ncbi:N-acetylmuramate alpha-1-phosphate uridylyltransferase MurU [Shewanella sp. SR44-3]|uniref:N-acetylmuramate alpha-1-phosphate uridylyltransferase MurU n=1 Tax=unclassified Shewanella TaxID=196818 RepID=UPI0015FA7372|nr:nucleotidyltransferase family protein [Shewanella sp. SR44-3]MBB1268681.1 nucleotidyltransferase family protein [Shewanella sp. SR44-3]
MKAMILAAGRGERLRPLTDTVPKPLVCVAGKPLIIYHLEKLAAIGVSEVVINHAWLGQKLIDTLGSGQRWGLTIHYSEEVQALETAGGIKKALPLLGDGPFLVINGDVFIESLPTLPELNAISPANHCLAHLWLVKNPSQHPNGDFGFLPQDDEQTILTQGLLRDDSLLKFTFSGIGLYHPQLFADIAEGAVPLGPLLREKMALGQVTGQLHDGFWCDVGTLERLVQLEAKLEIE